ncbi:MAG: hypothetical protein AABY22_24845 [Nanoarchaeota archaeon]
MKLYNIRAINKFKITKESTDYQKYLHRQYDLISKDYNSNLPFVNEPTEEEVIDVLRLLCPENEYFVGGMQITYLRDLLPKEL